MGQLARQVNSRSNDKVKDFALNQQIDFIDF